VNFFLCLGVIVCVLYIVTGLFVVLFVLCFTSLVSFTGFYTEDEPEFMASSLAHRQNAHGFCRHMYAKAKDIDFSSAKKLKEKLDQKVEDLQQPQASKYIAVSSSATTSAAHQRLSACSAHHRLRKKKLTRGNGSALCQTQPVQN